MPLFAALTKNAPGVFVEPEAQYKSAQMYSSVRTRREVIFIEDSKSFSLINTKGAIKAPLVLIGGEGKSVFEPIIQCFRVLEQLFSV